MKPLLGTCYYPEQWPEAFWGDDARRMVDAGLSLVRIGEFAWSKLEPSPDQFDWEWMDRAIQVLGEVGLDVVLGTPTAAPPRWMLERYPDMLAVNAHGQPRKFGSRRHYCFSHAGFRQASARIAAMMAQRYASNPAVTAWQIDNEYGCHDTVISYSEAAHHAFIQWLENKYHRVEALNHAWGNVFWSMQYDSFEQIDLPNLTVTEPNPAHCLDFRRFSSDQVIRYNRAQAHAIREYSAAPLIHNYMGRVTDFDHFELGDDLDIASWDSYPLGFLLDRSDADIESQQRFERQGDPDFQAFHHDLYRAVGKGRWWVMEQQPGPVNWAPNNPAPLPGMVRLWTWEAIAHQAEAVCYFRWRQAPFAQEQMHAGLLRPDNAPSATFGEIETTLSEVQEFGEIALRHADVALVFDYQSCWAWAVQPHASDFDYFSLVFDFYRGLRCLGLSVDIVPPSARDLAAYKLLLAPGLMTWPEHLNACLEDLPGVALLGPRTGSKTVDFALPDKLAPSIAGFDCCVSYVETFAKGNERALNGGGSIQTWLETVETSLPILEHTLDGTPVLIADGKIHYLAGWPDPVAMVRILKSVCATVGIEVTSMPDGVRKRATASHEFLFNYNAEGVTFEGCDIPAAGVIWRAINNEG